jgi:hypothetical protein
MIQMTICYNANYGPWMKAAFMTKKREALLEYISMHSSCEALSLTTTTGQPKWEDSAIMVAQDAREAPPQDDNSLLRLFDTTKQQLLADQTFSRQRVADDTLVAHQREHIQDATAFVGWAPSLDRTVLDSSI